MPTRSATGPSYRTVGAFGILIIALLAANVWVARRYATVPPSDVASEIGVACCFAVSGLLAWRLRPRSRIGRWMLALGVLALAVNPWDFHVVTRMPGHSVVALLGSPLAWLQYAMAGHIIVGYPSGRLSTRAERALVACAYGWAFTWPVVLLLTRVPDSAACAGWCYDSPIRVVADHRLYVVLLAIGVLGWVALAVGALVLVIRKAARATPYHRRTLGFAYLLLALALGFFAGYGVLDAWGFDGPLVTAVFQYGHNWLGVGGLPIGFLIGLLRERLAFASVGSLVSQLESAPTDAAEGALRQALHDPGLRVAFPTEAGWLDAVGQPCQPPGGPGRSTLPLGDPPVAVIGYDMALDEYPELLRAAAAAVCLNFKNARLQVEVRASQRRAVAAADAERQRLERDLHDGAQQRLLGAGLALAVLRNGLTGAGERALADKLDHELRGVIHELRDLAQGIRPAVLTDQGLAAALAVLARRAAVSVAIDLRIPRRFDPLIEATAYYVVSEALQNAVKHAPGARVRVRVAVEDATLHVEVSDDGPGGAVPSAGTGLRGLAERVKAVGGRFEVDSLPGQSTHIRAELPCA